MDPLIFFDQPSQSYFVHRRLFDLIEKVAYNELKSNNLDELCIPEIVDFYLEYIFVTAYIKFQPQELLQKKMRDSNSLPDGQGFVRVKIFKEDLLNRNMEQYQDLYNKRVNKLDSFHFLTRTSIYNKEMNELNM